jgi:hypothetical protein
LSRDSQLSADCTACTFGTAVCLGVITITKEEFLPAFFTAYQQTITVENITSSFRATDLAPFNPERVLEKLSPVIEATPSLQSSQTS